MTAEATFLNGAFKVKSGTELIGFLWVEPGPVDHFLPNGGQMQRWVLKDLLGHVNFLRFDFEEWPKGPKTLKEWNAAVRQTQSASGELVDDPLALWPRTKGATYIVAQSNKVMSIINNNGLLSFVPGEPFYPRREIVAAHSSKIVAASKTVESPQVIADKLMTTKAAAHVALPARNRRPAPQKPPRLPPPVIQGPPPPPPSPLDSAQTNVPFFQMEQYDLNNVSPGPGTPASPPSIVGCGAGEIDENWKESQFYEGRETFLFYPSFASIGTLGLRTRWDIGGEKLFSGVESMRAYTSTHPFAIGSRCEVIGCNYYQDIYPPAESTPPPDWFVAPEGI